jgi:hypothetical protein
VTLSVVPAMIAASVEPVVPEAQPASTKTEAVNIAANPSVLFVFLSKGIPFMNYFLHMGPTPPLLSKPNHESANHPRRRQINRQKVVKRDQIVIN